MELPFWDHDGVQYLHGAKKGKDPSSQLSVLKPFFPLQVRARGAALLCWVKVISIVRVHPKVRGDLIGPSRGLLGLIKDLTHHER